MSYNIINLTAAVLNKEINQFLADFPENHYVYLTFSVPYFRQKLIAKILSQIPNRHLVVNEDEDFFEEANFDQGIVQERLLIEKKIRENIPYLLYENKSERKTLKLKKPLNKLSGLPLWIKCNTIIPPVTYFFGPFNSFEEAKLNLKGYLDDLIQEKAEGISWEINNFQPTSLTIFHDVQEIEQENKELWNILNKTKIEKQYYQDLFQFAPESYIVADLKGIIQAANYAANKLFHLTTQSLLGKSLELFVSKSDLPKFYAQLEQLRQESTSINDQKDWLLQLETPNFFPVIVNIKSSRIMDMDNHLIGWRLLLHNITQDLQIQQQLYLESRYDSLTHLPNRRLLLEYLDLELLNQQNTSKQFAVLFLDIDNFKAINDEFGHEFGDLVLIDFAKRLVTCVRLSDRVARLSGDEFIVILSPLESPEDAQNTAIRIKKALSYPFHINKRQLIIDASIGIVISNLSNDDHSNLLPHADFAMYQAKKQKVPFVLHSETIVAKCLEIQEELQRFENQPA